MVHLQSLPLGRSWTYMSLVPFFFFQFSTEDRKLTRTFPLFSLLTPSEVFQLMRDEGFNVDYERLPGKYCSLNRAPLLAHWPLAIVTDEQAPLPAIYSRIEERVVASLKESKETGSEVGFVFQCQMGRGRTTTVCLPVNSGT